MVRQAWPRFSGLASRVEVCWVRLVRCASSAAGSSADVGEMSGGKKFKKIRFVPMQTQGGKSLYSNQTHLQKWGDLLRGF